MVKIVGYARKSPDEKEKTETSIKNQVDLFNKICIEKSNENEKWELEKVFIDKNISGGDRYRKGFIEMINYCIKNPIDIIICKDQDRFARDSSFFLDTLKDLEVHNIKVYSIIKGGFLSADEIGDAIMSVVNGQYIIEQRKKYAILQSQKQGNSLPCIPAPFGYKYDKKKNWIIISKRAEIVKEIYKDKQNSVDYKETIKKLKIDKNCYYRVMKNIEKGVYFGWVVYDKKIKGSDKKVFRIEKIKYKGTYEPIIIDGNL